MKPARTYPWKIKFADNVFIGVTVKIDSRDNFEGNPHVLEIQIDSQEWLPEFIFHIFRKSRWNSNSQHPVTYIFNLFMFLKYCPTFYLPIPVLTSTDYQPQLGLLPLQNPPYYTNFQQKNSLLKEEKLATFTEKWELNFLGIWSDVEAFSWPSTWRSVPTFCPGLYPCSFSFWSWPWGFPTLRIFWKDSFVRYQGSWPTFFGMDLETWYSGPEHFEMRVRWDRWLT